MAAFLKDGCRGYRCPVKGIYLSPYYIIDVTSNKHAYVFVGLLSGAINSSWVEAVRLAAS